MSDRINNDLAAILTPPPSRGVQFTQARVLSWDNERLHNTLEWRGITITDVPIVEGINALVIREGDIVGMFGWAPQDGSTGSWWIIGKLSNPGEFVADLNVTAKIFRFVTEDGNPLAFFGKESDGDPLWILYYGGADGQSAIRIVNGDSIKVNDRNGNEVVGTDAATGVGLSRPWIPYHITPTHSAIASGTTYTPAVTSASFTAMWRGFNPCFHPRVSYGVSVVATGTTEWRIRVDVGSGFTTVASGGGNAAATFDVPNWGTGAGPTTVAEFVLEGRNTGGGTSHIAIDRFYGRQS